MMVDMDNRWVYKGSVTTPPCQETVYWNVLRTVYPIKERHLKQFQDDLALDKFDKAGNFRLIQELKDQDPYIITTPPPRASIFMILFLLFLIISIVLLVAVIKLTRANNAGAKQVANASAADFPIKE